LIPRSNRLSTDGTIQVTGNGGRQSQKNQGDDGDDSDGALNGLDHGPHLVGASGRFAAAAGWNGLQLFRVVTRPVDSAAFERGLDAVDELLGLRVVVIDEFVEDFSHGFAQLSGEGIEKDDHGDDQSANDDHRNEEHSEETFALLPRSAAADSGDEENDAADDDDEDGGAAKIRRGNFVDLHFLQDFGDFGQETVFVRQRPRAYSDATSGQNRDDGVKNAESGLHASPHIRDQR